MSDSRSELMRFLDGGVSPVHTVAMAKEFLTEHGFSALPLAEPFSVRRGGRYYIESGSFLAAVTVGSRDTLRIAAAHTDWPCMRIKPDPELVAGGCCRVLAAAVFVIQVRGWPGVVVIVEVDDALPGLVVAVSVFSIVSFHRYL